MSVTAAAHALPVEFPSERTSAVSAPATDAPLVLTVESGPSSESAWAASLLLFARYCDSSDPLEIIDEDRSVSELLPSNGNPGLLVVPPAPWSISANGLSLEWNGAAMRFVVPAGRQTQASLDQIARHWQRLERGIVAWSKDPALAARPVAELPMLEDSEIQTLLGEWNHTNHSVDEAATLVSAFERQVDATPDAIAARFGGASLSYRDLDRRANALAGWIGAQSLGQNPIVGILAERSLEMLVGLYGILKAGAAYLPIEPTLPHGRIETLIEESGTRLLLTHSSLLGRAHSLDVVTQAIDSPEFAPETGNERHPHLRPTADSIAYCIFTSGSTGKPKGVLIRHRSICNRLFWMQGEFPLSLADRVLQKTPFGFDISVWELFWPLQVGATLYILPPEQHKSARDVAMAIRRDGITIAHFVPSMLSAFLEEPSARPCGETLKRVFCGGEAISYSITERFFSVFPNSEFVNLYGPTEAAVDITCWRIVPHDPRGIVPIGRPLWNCQVHVLDSRRRLMPRIATGELYLGGVQLAAGYLGRPDLTAERFVPNPFEAGTRLYRTGDLTRWLPDGAIEYLGRNDFQVKINGLRIELGEIESAIQAIPGVANVAVSVIQTPAGAKQLCAFLVRGPTGSELMGSAVKDRLAGQLPSYMVPTHIAWLPEVPLTASGKFDRKKLPLTLPEVLKLR